MVRKSLKKLNEKEFNMKHHTANLKQKKKKRIKKIIIILKKKRYKNLSCASEINAPPEEIKYQSYPML